MSFSATSRRYVRIFQVYTNKYWPRFNYARPVVFRIVGTREEVTIARRCDTGAEVEFCLI